jgi:N-acetylmuramoyl-L-alanine amidase
VLLKFKIIRLLTLIGGLVLFTSFHTDEVDSRYRLKTVIIDAGHGGHDTGCIGSSSYEKHVALAIAIKLGDMIQKQYPNIKVVYTRKTDVFVELHERAAIANRHRADLFICIHCNSGPKAAFGTETYVMGLHKSADNLAVAKRENSSILLEKDYKTHYDGFDPNSPEANIIFSLYQNSFMHQSLEFASLVQTQFEKKAGRYNRGVKQAGFLVLYKTAMPSVLIETGFLTNNTEEKYLRSAKGQTAIASAILRAFNEYKTDTEARAGAPVSESTGEPVVKSNPSNNSVISSSNPGKGSSTSSSGSPSGQPKVFYTVQVAAISSDKGIGGSFHQANKPFKLIGDDGLTRYYSGVFTDISSARNNLAQVKGKGFGDAFLVAFNGPKRISVAKAEELLKRK